jgi:hypothetical protein
MIQVSEIDQEHRQYYEYLNRNYNEIVAYLQENDGSMDPHKRDLFFDKISLPFVIWKESKGVTQARPDREIDQNERKSFLDALVRNRKYTLQKIGDVYIIRANLGEERMKELEEKMKAAGYTYDSGKKGFVEVKQ